MSNHGNTVRSVDVTASNSSNFPIADQSRRNRRLHLLGEHTPLRGRTSNSCATGRENALDDRHRGQLPPRIDFRENRDIDYSANGFGVPRTYVLCQGIRYRDFRRRVFYELSYTFSTEEELVDL